MFTQRKTCTNIPTIRPTAKGYARVTLNGHDIHLGKLGSPEAQAKYDEAIAIWLANGRRYPLPGETEIITVAQLHAAYLKHASTYYVKNGKPTKTVAFIQRLGVILKYQGMMKLDCDTVRTADLLDFQEWAVADPHNRWARKTINGMRHTIISMFKWGAARHGIAPVWRDLEAVTPLRRGRGVVPDLPPPRDAEPRQPVNPTHLELTLKECTPMIAAMINLQLASGMRPGEVCAIRAEDIFITKVPSVMVYQVRDSANKTAHVDRRRNVYLGPRAMAILQPWLDLTPTGPIFSPRVNLEMHYAQKAKDRKTPRYGRALKYKRPAGFPADRCRETYDSCSYRHAILRACERACRRQGLEGDQAWSWSPHQLRHNAATFIANNESLEVARILLGHSDISMTLRYVHGRVDETRATGAALRLA